MSNTYMNISVLVFCYTCAHILVKCIFLQVEKLVIGVHMFNFSNNAIQFSKFVPVYAPFSSVRECQLLRIQLRGMIKIPVYLKNLVLLFLISKVEYLMRSIYFYIVQRNLK